MSIRLVFELILHFHLTIDVNSIDCEDNYYDTDDDVEENATKEESFLENFLDNKLHALLRYVRE